MSVKKKLFLGFSVVLLLFIVVAVTNIVVQRMVTKQRIEVDNLQAAEKSAENLRYLTMTVSSTGAYYLLSNSQQDSDTNYQTYMKNVQAAQDAFAKIAQITSDRESHQFLNAARDAFIKYINGNDVAFMIYKVSIKLGEDGKTLEKDPAGVIQAQKQYFSVVRDPVFDNLAKYTNTLDKQVSQNQVLMQNLQNLASWLNIILTLLAIIIGSLIIFFISNSLTKSLTLLQAASAEIADGILTEQVTVKSKDELGELAKAFNKMSLDLNKLVKEVIDTASSLGSASMELFASAEEATAASEHVSQMTGKLETGATNQVRAVEETRDAINQLVIGSQNVAGHAENVSQSSEKVAQAAELGVDQAENAIKKIEVIREVTDQTGAVVALLCEQSNNIGQIIDVIKDIADQTNLLALNAAIEAAREGEHGRGFAVVAEEVRKLAVQSSSSAQQISMLISNIQRDSHRAVQMMEKGRNEVAAGVETVNLTGKAFRTIVTEINVVADQMQQVSLATQQMAVGITQVLKSVDNIAGVSEQSQSSTQEVSAATEEQFATMESVRTSAEELARLGESLMGLVVRFKV